MGEHTLILQNRRYKYPWDIFHRPYRRLSEGNYLGLGGIKPIIEKLKKKNVITYWIAYNFRYCRGFNPNEDL